MGKAESELSVCGPGYTARQMITDPFTLLGLPRRFDLDRTAIEHAYLGRLTAAPSSSEGGGFGDEPAGSDPGPLNAARRVLLDGESRANALLGLLGGPGKESDRSLPPGFLGQMMEVRERMEAAAGDPVELAKFEAWAIGQRDGHTARVAEMFRGSESCGNAANASILKQIRMELNAWRYIERMLEQVHGGGGGSGGGAL